MAWQVEEGPERGERVLAPFSSLTDAHMYLIARVDRWEETGWKVVGYRGQPHVRVTLARGKDRMVVEAKPLVT